MFRDGSLTDDVQLECIAGESLDEVQVVHFAGNNLDGCYGQSTLWDHKFKIVRALQRYKFKSERIQTCKPFLSKDTRTSLPQGSQPHSRPTHTRTWMKEDSGQDCRNHAVLTCQVGQFHRWVGKFNGLHSTCGVLVQHYCQRNLGLCTKASTIKYGAVYFVLNVDCSRLSLLCSALFKRHNWQSKQA